MITISIPPYTLTNLINKQKMYNYFMCCSEDGRISHELNSINQAGFVGMLVGGLWGGYLQSRITYMNYMENNQATVFDNHLDAKRHLQTQMSLGFAKGAFRWAWRLTLFTTTFVYVS
jgi:hypothetical protein